MGLVETELKGHREVTFTFCQSLTKGSHFNSLPRREIGLYDHVPAVGGASRNSCRSARPKVSGCEAQRIKRIKSVLEMPPMGFISAELQSIGNCSVSMSV